MSLTPPKNLSAVSLTPVNKFSAVSLIPAINFRLFGYFWLVSTTRGKNLSPVSLTPAVNCSPVSTSPPAINCIDDRGLLLLQNYLRPPKSATAANIVIGHSHENAQRHLTYLDQRPRRPLKLLQTKLALFSFCGLRASDQDVWDVYGCNFSWRFQWHHRRPWPTSAAGDIADLYPSTLAAPHLHGVLVLVTGNKFIAGVVFTGDKFFTCINDTGDHWKSVTKINRLCRWHR